MVLPIRTGFSFNHCLPLRNGVRVTRAKFRRYLKIRRPNTYASATCRFFSRNVGGGKIWQRYGITLANHLLGEIVPADEASSDDPPILLD
nr:hypothetical protein [Halomonas sp.]